MRIFLINLDRSPERLAFMREQLAQLELPVERLPAVDGAAIDLSPYASTGLSAGEIGCFLSHREAWRQLVASRDEAALVLEDDVRISPQLPSALAPIDGALAGADIVKLDTSRRVVELEQAAAAAGPVQLHRLRGEHTGTGGYVVSRAIATALLDRSELLDRPVDLFLFGAGTIETRHVLQAVPALVAQEKQFRKVDGGALGSVIRQGKARRAGFVPLLAREGKRILRRLGRTLRRLPHRIRGTRRYIRVPFR